MMRRQLLVYLGKGNSVFFLPTPVSKFVIFELSESHCGVSFYGMYRPDPIFFSSSKRLDYVNHARRLAEDDWTGMESGEEENKKDEEEMDIDPSKKLPKRYANQVSGPERAPSFHMQSNHQNTCCYKKRAGKPSELGLWGI
jgi:hypothetical protein